MDAINILEMTVLNEGNKPTFMTENRSEVIDITFINKYAENTVINWRVSNTETFSDHNQIEYIVLSEDNNKPTKRTFKNIRNMNEKNWDTFKINIENNLHLLWEAENQDIHKKAEALTKLFTRAQLTTIPKATIAKKKHKQWWTKELTEMKKEMEMLRRKIKRNQRKY